MPLPDVPILNQPVTLITWYPTTILRCNCMEKINIIVLTGINNTVMCGNCRKSFMVRGMRQDGSVDLVMMMPPAEGVQ